MNTILLIKDGDMMKTTITNRGKRIDYIFFCMYNIKVKSVLSTCQVGLSHCMWPYTKVGEKREMKSNDIYNGITCT